MPLYRVIVRGRNFRLNMAGKCERSDHPVICGGEIVEVLQLQDLEKAPAALTFYKE